MCEAGQEYLLAESNFEKGDRYYRKYPEGVCYLQSCDDTKGVTPLPTQNQIQRWLKKRIPTDEGLFYGFRSFLVKGWLVKDIFNFDILWLMFFFYYIHNLCFDFDKEEWKEIPEEKNYRIAS
jgi:hypothetical protein